MSRKAYGAGRERERKEGVKRKTGRERERKRGRGGGVGGGGGGRPSVRNKGEESARSSNRRTTLTPIVTTDKQHISSCIKFEVLRDEDLLSSYCLLLLFFVSFFTTVYHEIFLRSNATNEKMTKPSKQPAI